MKNVGERDLSNGSVDRKVAGRPNLKLQVRKKICASPVILHDSKERIGHVNGIIPFMTTYDKVLFSQKKGGFWFGGCAKKQKIPSQCSKNDDTGTVRSRDNAYN